MILQRGVTSKSMCRASIVRVGYKTVLRAKRAIVLLVCTPTCDIL